MINDISGILGRKAFVRSLYLDNTNEFIYIRNNTFTMSCSCMTMTVMSLSRTTGLVRKKSGLFAKKEVIKMGPFFCPAGASMPHRDDGLET